MRIDAILTFGGLEVTGSNGTAGIFSTYPADYLSLGAGVIDQVCPLFSLMLIQSLNLNAQHNL